MNLLTPRGADGLPRASGDSSAIKGVRTPPASSAPAASAKPGDDTEGT
jgi:hypothetical protein